MSGRTAVLRTARARAVLSTAVRPDTVFLPFHFGGEGSANLLTSDTTDPASGMPEFKANAVTIAVPVRA